MSTDSAIVMTSVHCHLNPFDKQECIPVGCVPSAAVAVCWGDLPARGGEMSARGVLPARGVCLVCPGGCPLCTEFLTHACENITFQQLRLRTVTSRWQIYIHFVSILALRNRFFCNSISSIRTACYLFWKIKLSYHCIRTLYHGNNVSPVYMG